MAGRGGVPGRRRPTIRRRLWHAHSHTHTPVLMFLFFLIVAVESFFGVLRVGVRIVSKSRRQWFVRGGRLVDVAVRGGSVPSSVSHVWRKWDTGHAGRSHRRSQRLLDAW